MFAGLLSSGLFDFVVPAELKMVEVDAAGGLGGFFRHVGLLQGGAHRALGALALGRVQVELQQLGVQPAVLFLHGHFHTGRSAAQVQGVLRVLRSLVSFHCLL